MKKVLLFLAIAIAMVSCKGDEGPMGPPGYDGQNGAPGQNGKPGEPGYGANWYTHTFNIATSDWKLKGLPGELNSYYYADFDLAKLTDFVFDEGTVIGYIETAKDVKNGLPYVLHLGEVEGGKEFLWTQTYDFDFMPGNVRFYATYSDFETGKKPGGEKFHIVLMW